MKWDKPDTRRILIKDMVTSGSTTLMGLQTLPAIADFDKESGRSQKDMVFLFQGDFNTDGSRYGLMIWGKYLGDKMLRTTYTLHLRSFASIDSEQKKLFLYLLNKTDRPQAIHLDIRNKEIKSVIQA